MYSAMLSLGPDETRRRDYLRCLRTHKGFRQVRRAYVQDEISHGCVSACHGALRERALQGLSSGVRKRTGLDLQSAQVTVR